MTPTEGLALKLRYGEISFDEFARQTRDYWRGQSLRLLARWRHPSDATPEDLVQVMLLEVWIRMSKFDPEKGGPDPRAFGRYLIWNAHDKAKKWLHRARGAVGARGNAPSRFARPLSSYTVAFDGEEERLPVRIEQAMSHDPTTTVERQIDVIVLAEEAIHRASDERVAAGLVALKLTRFDEQAAAERLYRDRYCRVVFDLESRDHAERLIDRALAAL